MGENKNDKIITDENLFKKNFLESLKNVKINSRNVLISLYYAYAKTHNKNFEKLKIILMHPHEKKTTLKFFNYFTDSVFLIPIRNPFRAYEGIIKKIKYVNTLRGREYYPSGQLIESALDIKDFYESKLSMYFIKLENLGFNKEKIMKRLSEILEIDFNETMLKSTFGGKKYWSNSIEKQTNHFDKSRHTGEINLPRKDLIILDLINAELNKLLSYESIKLRLSEKLMIPFLIFFPMKDEIDFIKNFKISKFFIYLKFFFIFFPKRIRMLQIILLNKFSKKYEYISKKIIN